jgi:amidase
MAPSSKAKPKRPWQEIAREAQEYRDASIATFTKEFPTTYATGKSADLPKDSTDIPSGVLEKRDLQITETLPEELVKVLANGELSATEVTTAFLRRAALAQKLVSSREILSNPL